MFLTEVGNKDQTELNTSDKMLSFKLRVDKVKTDQTTGEFIVICQKKKRIQEASQEYYKDKHQDS